MAGLGLVGTAKHGHHHLTTICCHLVRAVTQSLGALDMFNGVLRVTIKPPPTASEGSLMGHLSRRLVEILADRDLTERQAAARVGLPYESFRKILRGLTQRPRDATLRKIADGLGVPVERLAEERARDANEKFASPFVLEDITASEALDIAIARVNELPDSELEPVRAQAEQLLRAMQREATRGPSDPEG